MFETKTGALILSECRSTLDHYIPTRNHTVRALRDERNTVMCRICNQSRGQEDFEKFVEKTRDKQRQKENRKLVQTNRPDSVEQNTS